MDPQSDSQEDERKDSLSSDEVVFQVPPEEMQAPLPSGDQVSSVDELNHSKQSNANDANAYYSNQVVIEDEDNSTGESNMDCVAEEKPEQTTTPECVKNEEKELNEKQAQKPSEECESLPSLNFTSASQKDAAPQLTQSSTPRIKEHPQNRQNTSTPPQSPSYGYGHLSPSTSANALEVKESSQGEQNQNEISSFHAEDFSTYPSDKPQKASIQSKSARSSQSSKAGRRLSAGSTGMSRRSTKSSYGTTSSSMGSPSRRSSRPKSRASRLSSSLSSSYGKGPIQPTVQRRSRSPCLLQRTTLQSDSIPPLPSKQEEKTSLKTRGSYSSTSAHKPTSPTTSTTSSMSSPTTTSAGSGFGSGSGSGSTTADMTRSSLGSTQGMMDGEALAQQKAEALRRKMIVSSDVQLMQARLAKMAMEERNAREKEASLRKRKEEAERMKKQKEEEERAKEERLKALERERGANAAYRWDEKKMMQTEKMKQNEYIIQQRRELYLQEKQRLKQGEEAKRAFLERERMEKKRRADELNRQKREAEEERRRREREREEQIHRRTQQEIEAAEEAERNDRAKLRELKAQEEEMIQRLKEAFEREEKAADELERTLQI
ncbi:uncharacterized protein MONOS_10416 [Monocercomonoides exilis]|uniref:uncharacterized protein n=1 Tax=Monocercomonoides exilis TaxID=2049356 RepID=UPI00355A58D7|nr:hypothetical protein MONOS_10416 [Monocercomonoides exilis]|eukprot:MONOS_10416.1-p1 / transcript=MONOS_10416.1 / gene=MONOS_10416 / organism=Monocercomonoides_exilis_PA203 / gene_product=unspecified product / transcript_product=unspecified product / location=Mono_scaffold00473:43159-45389(-) / protein_length=604 / sequence_SO=supercontig / SO=protein_coding / is_pseudo=false